MTISEYPEKWDESSTDQTNDFFIGKSGYITILWHVVNNPMEKYDPSKSYHMQALDGSALYVWCDLKFTYTDAFIAIDNVADTMRVIDHAALDNMTVHHL